MEKRCKQRFSKAQLERRRRTPVGIEPETRFEDSAELQCAIYTLEKITRFERAYLFGYTVSKMLQEIIAENRSRKLARKSVGKIQRRKLWGEISKTVN